MVAVRRYGVDWLAGAAEVWAAGDLGDNDPVVPGRVVDDPGSGEQPVIPSRAPDIRNNGRMARFPL
jgi:hypothetical protein